MLSHLQRMLKNQKGTCSNLNSHRFHESIERATCFDNCYQTLEAVKNSDGKLRPKTQYLGVLGISFFELC